MLGTDLNKLDEWRTIIPLDQADLEWFESEGEDDSEDDDSEDDEDEDEDEEMEEATEMETE